MTLHRGRLRARNITLNIDQCIVVYGMLSFCPKSSVVRLSGFGGAADRRGVKRRPAYDIMPLRDHQTRALAGKTYIGTGMVIRGASAVHAPTSEELTLALRGDFFLDW